MASLAAGDARAALSLLEHVILASTDTSESALLDSMKRSVATSYDRTGDARYDLISALHKSIRGSQGGAALYWLARMLEADEDPMYIARRLVVCASEDIGMADPYALPLVSTAAPLKDRYHCAYMYEQAMAALQACQAIGMPECRINLAHVITYLSEAPKSTRAYVAYERAQEFAKQDMTLPVPISIRNAPTRMLKELGYGEGYKYQPGYAYEFCAWVIVPQSVLMRKPQASSHERLFATTNQWGDYTALGKRPDREEVGRGRTKAVGGDGEWWKGMGREIFRNLSREGLWLSRAHGIAQHYHQWGLRYWNECIIYCAISICNSMARLSSCLLAYPGDFRIRRVLGA
jgi:replication-associated recombination protein RarA